MPLPINSFIYRKKDKYDYQYYYVNFFTEKALELSSQVSGFIHADDEVTLTNVEDLPDQKYKILPISTFALTVGGHAMDAGKMTVDQLIDCAYKAAKITLERDKLS